MSQRVSRHEGSFLSADQGDLFFQTWTPDKIRGRLIITHGLAEHSECYQRIAKPLAEDGWQVFAWDLRGHGRSEGKRGFVLDIAKYIADLEIFLSLVRKQAQAGDPLILFGHSMGGLITTRLIQTVSPDYSALVLSSPALGLSMPVPKVKEMIAHVAIKWVPTLTLHNEIKYSDLTRDGEILRSFEKDTLRHDKISPGIFLSMVDNFPKAMAEADKISQPVVMFVAGQDKLVSTVAAREFFASLPNKKNQIHLYPESYHEVFNDLDRDKALADLKAFVNPYLLS